MRSIKNPSVGMFSKKKKKKNKDVQEELRAMGQSIDVRDSGLVADYEQVSTANPKVIAMLGINDGTSVSTRGPPAEFSAGSINDIPKEHGRKKSGGARTPSLKMSKLVSIGRRSSDGNSQDVEDSKGKRGRPSGGSTASLIDSGHLKLSDHSENELMNNSGRTSRGHDIDNELSLGLIEDHGRGFGRKSCTRRKQLDHTQLLFETDFEDMVFKERLKDWASSFRRTDPRFKIMKYFNDVAVSGVDDIEQRGSVTRAELLSPILAMFRRAAVFTVWRPTSTEAIKKMMLRRGTGKGLNIKGKSAKGGELSGYVPFVQISEERHKSAIKPLPRNAKIRVFYRKQQVRDEAAEALRAISTEMSEAVEEARMALESGSSPNCSKEEAERRMAWWDAANMDVTLIDDYAGNKGWGPFAKGFGIELSERLFWEGYVTRQNIERDAGSIYDTGRRSEPAYQDMNFGSTRVRKKGDPRTVVWQHADPKKGQTPLEPRTLLVAYEENNLVLPVVSDFDCFLVGTRAVQFEKPIPDEQVEMLNWCVEQIDGILSSPGKDPWSKRWLDVLKKNKPTGKGALIPRFGYGDPKTYSIMECAVDRLGESGAVRHGAECFNYYFPQDLDAEYLVILGDADAGKVPWVYVNEEELRELLIDKIDRGFTFPLNPKWVLCDPGWKEVYDKLLQSQASNVQASLDCWYPPSSGIREKIEEVCAKHPYAFSTIDEFGKKSAAPRRGLSRSDNAQVLEVDLEVDLELEQLQTEQLEDGVTNED